MDALRASWQSIPNWVFVLLYTAWTVGSVVFLLMQRRRPTATLAWLIAFLSLPFVAALFYLFFGPSKLRRKRVKRELAKEIAARIGRPANATVPGTLASRNWLASLARIAASQDNPPPRPSRGVKLLIDGDQTYAAIEAAIAAATRQIHVEYYIFEPDEVGTRWRDLLARRAADGLTVRVLLDAVGSSACRSSFWAPLEAAGGELRWFNPVRILRLKPGLVNFRSHRKIVVIDGELAFTGGINVSKGNSGSSSGSSAWRDTHLQVAGAPALDLQMVFLEDWLYAGSEDPTRARRDRRSIATPVDIDRWFAPQHDAGREADGPWVQIIDSGPDEQVADIHRFVFTAIALSRRRCWITTPYFVPDEPMMAAIVTACARGVDVRLLIPREGDSRLVSAAARTFAEEAAAEGVPVYEYADRMIHAKTIVVDDELAIVGTANLDNRSFRLNFEVIAAIYDTGIARELAARFQADLASARRLEPDADGSGFAQRLLGSTARLLAPIL
ncbi:MAG: cardiolipin synthase [Lautropia sp.]